jgi:DNA polymerase-3 subunit delta'
MSSADAPAAFTVRKPQETSILVGHRAAELALLDAYKSGRIAHAWLIGGLQGIGKATLAYRMARFVLAHPDPRSPEVRAATTLDVDADSHAARMVASGAHGGLLTLQRTFNDKGVLRTVITIDEVRETVSFFGSTAAAGGWRVCVVDCMDELNANGANALLKILEEPPPRSLFLLVSHAPARLLPTIHSRCRKLALRPLTAEEVVQAIAHATDIAPESQELADAAALSDGSVGRVLSLMDARALRLNRRVTALLDALPRVDPMELHALGDLMPLNDKATLSAFIGGVERWIEQQVGVAGAASQPDLPRLARFAEVWEKIGRAGRETADYNLERKPLVFSVVGLLAEAAAA